MHLLDPDGLRAVRGYYIKGFPTYLIIDRGGRVLDADAPRPSDGARTVAALNRALAAK